MNNICTKLILVLAAIVLLTACSLTTDDTTDKGEQDNGNVVDGVVYERYRGNFFDTFDTVVSVVGYTETEEEFVNYMGKIEARFIELHKLYDIYKNYEGINNVKTINDKAGIEPVKVDKEIIDLILFCKEWYGKSYGKTNISMGPVLKIWHEYREEGEYDPFNAKLPPMDELQAAAQHIDINKVIVDTENSTVYLEDKAMSLDVGAVAKGFATELVAQEIMADGFTSGMISAGGNVRAFDKPLDNQRERWGVGIQDPDKIAILAEENLLDTIFLNNASVVSSGDYQRYYIVDGELIHHLINPDTLMPGNYYRAVTVVTEDSGLADYLSTVVFMLPYEQSRQFVESLGNVEALWIMPDNTIEVTDGMKKMMKSNGATGIKESKQTTN